MPRMRFCSACGEPTTTRVVLRVFGLLCGHCSPRFKRERAFVVAAFFLCLSAVFAIARYTAPREPFYFIGTPVELNAEKLRPSASTTAPLEGTNGLATNKKQVPAFDSTRLAGSICGAPTKSGRPCQRKVRITGYCWQHREKFTEAKR